MTEVWLSQNIAHVRICFHIFDEVTQLCPLFITIRRDLTKISVVSSSLKFEKTPLALLCSHGLGEKCRCCNKEASNRLLLQIHWGPPSRTGPKSSVELVDTLYNHKTKRKWYALILFRMSVLLGAKMSVNLKFCIPSP